MTVSSSPSHDYTHASLWQLIAVFVLALLLLLALRWQPEAWLRGQITTTAAPYGITLDYQQLQTDGLAIRLHDVRISGGRLPMPLLFDTVRLAPSWMSLLQLKPAAHLYLNWQDIAASATVLQHNQFVELADIEVAGSVAALPAMLKLPVPVQLGGELLVSGEIHLDGVSGRPLSGVLNGRWQQATAGLGGSPDPLGDYSVSLNNDDPTKAWQWQLAGGAGVMLQGHGTLITQSGLPQQWIINGQLSVSGGQSIPHSLKAMLAKPMNFDLSGALATLRLQPR
ncbi:MAG: hypothetical protein CO188_00310 [Zetaproteobacteria bacterium CG_4_9_14_3_um_filter_54_145]|nr:MAG: hypothetical protein COZ50_08285 [Zetaproteobacteria bacterium CG_4_10_14_3_um_filter_54_28]PJA31141.1 MAG: hypothetical protein CO188_00310 [Zetaproteobacteria bacterium CG_4_9_14_3_um_filter_54_145]